MHRAVLIEYIDWFAAKDVLQLYSNIFFKDLFALFVIKAQKDSNE